jgi:heme ABC exporter ATP-binding subunit CcmA
VTARAVGGRNLVQRFGARVVLGPLQLTLRERERLAVLGGNGAGKTTLLRILATAARPAAGSLELLGLDAVRQRERLRGRIGYLGHQPGLHPALSPRETLELFATLHGVDRRRVPERLAQVGLTQVAGERVERLSRGQQQRLALARAVLHDPELLVLDEPDASLDAEGRRLLGELAEGRTLVMATHDRELARQLCERALLLQAGLDRGDPWGLRVLEA